MAININKALIKELQSIRNIGPVMAKRIVLGRPYKDIYELSKVRGLGKARMEMIIADGGIKV